MINIADMLSKPAIDMFIDWARVWSRIFLTGKSIFFSANKSSKIIFLISTSFNFSKTPSQPKKRILSPFSSVFYTT